jgi:hypothetical protein
MQDVLFGSDYAPDGSDFEGFAKKKNVPTPPDFERTLLLVWGDGVTMHAAGARRWGSVGLAYVPTAWRVRAFDVTGAPTVVSCEISIERIGWDDTVTDMVGAGTKPVIVGDTKGKSATDDLDWDGGNGEDGDVVRATLDSITPGAAVYLVLAIDFQPA